MVQLMWSQRLTQKSMTNTSFCELLILRKIEYGYTESWIRLKSSKNVPVNPQMVAVIA